MRAEIEKKEFEKKFQELSKKYESGMIAIDRGSYIDKLSRNTYAKILTRHIAKKTTKTPLNVGVFGEWGEGKSSFLNLIEKEIESFNKIGGNHINKMHVVRYNASEYDERQKIWASMLAKLFDKFENLNKFRAKFSFARVSIIDGLKENITKYVINAIMLILSMVWLYFLKGENLSLSILENKFLGIEGIIPFIMSIINILIPFIKQQIKFIQPLSSRVVSKIELPNYKQDLGFRENIKKD